MPRWASSSHNRVTGFLEACSELDGVTGQTMDMQAGDDPVDAALTALLARDDAPTALCFHQDSLAIPLFFRLRQCGMAIPADLSVTGFDNSTFSGEVGLTTVRQKPYDMAVAAARARPWTLSRGAPWTSRTRSSPCNCWYATPPPRRGCAAERAESVVIRAAVVGLGFAVPASYRHERDADDDGQEDGASVAARRMASDVAFPDLASPDLADAAESADLAAVSSPLCGVSPVNQAGSDGSYFPGAGPVCGRRAGV